MNLEQTWKFFCRCIEDSSKVTGWPHSFSRLSTLGQPLTDGTVIEAKYKLGPLGTKAQYLLENVVSKKQIGYRTTDAHILRGKSKILFKAVKGGTLCHWSGVYSSKGISSLPALAWFKLFFEPVFFGLLKRKTGKR